MPLESMVLVLQMSQALLVLQESLVLLVLQMSQALLVPQEFLVLLVLQVSQALLSQACCQVPPCNGAYGTSRRVRCRMSWGIGDIRILPWHPRLALGPCCPRLPPLRPALARAFSCSCAGVLLTPLHRCNFWSNAGT